MGLSNGIGTIAGLICPIAIDHITNGQVNIKTPISCTTLNFCYDFLRFMIFNN